MTAWGQDRPYHSGSTGFLQTGTQLASTRRGRQSKPEVQLAEALVNFQGDVEVLKKDSENAVYGSKFTSLAELHKVIKPLKKKHGLAVVQLPTTLDGKPALRTIVMHKSGASIEDTMLLLTSRQDPQGQGSAITYAKRYAEQAALGVVSEDEDDDGNAGSNKQATGPIYKPGKGEPPTDEQLRAITNLLRSLNADPDQAAKTLSMANSKLNAALIIQKLQNTLTGREDEPTNSEPAEPPASDEQPPAVDEPPTPEEPSPPVDKQFKKDIEHKLGQLGLSDDGRRKFSEWAVCKPFDAPWTDDDFRTLNTKADEALAGKYQLHEEWLERSELKTALDDQLDQTFEVPQPKRLSDEEKKAISDLVDDIGLTKYGQVEFIKRVTGEKRFLAGLSDTQWLEIHKAAKAVLDTEEQLPDSWFAGYVPPDGKEKAAGES